MLAASPQRQDARRGRKEEAVIVELLGVIVFVTGLVALFAGAITLPSQGPSGGAEALLIGGPIGVMLGAILIIAGLI